ncbi:MAG: GDCCVxC domain-containing (seleno)protein [Pyrinomonadaceae bacterium]
MNEMELISIVTCPNCKFEKTETMPHEYCQFFYECESCKEILRPAEGDCCVFCSFGSVSCPSMQRS